MKESRRCSLKRLFFIGLFWCWLATAQTQSAPSWSAPSDTTLAQNTPARSTPRNSPSLGSTTLSQTLRVTVPENKEVTPGEFVTLVFRLESVQDTSLEASATSALGWEILRQPGTIDLTANQAKPLALTLTIPHDAAAATTETLTLKIGDEVPLNVNLTVND